MRTIVGLVKIFLFILFTFFCGLIHLIVIVFIRLFDREQTIWNRSLVRFWAAGVSIIFNIKVNIIGHPPEPPFFLVCNHLSYLDIIPVFLYTKSTFVAKKEVRNWPYIGFIMEMVGIIFVDRTKKKDVIRVNEELKFACNEHQGITVFPEGTTSGGENVLQFKPSLLEIAATENLKVSYASIQYHTHSKDELAVNSVCFFGARDSFLGHLLKLAKNRTINCTIHFGDEKIQANNRKTLAKLLQKNVERIFVPTHQSVLR
jgi:lyso-ornithine lipid O-acyltransferase